MGSPVATPYSSEVHSTEPALPLALRLAVSYAPARSRALFAELFLLDRQLARIVARQSAPLVAQIGLAWWRERLNGDAASSSIAPAWSGSLEALTAMIDGWEELLAEEPDLLACASGRSAPFAALARKVGCDAVSAERARASALRWSLIDLADHLSVPAESEKARELARALPFERVPLPRTLRPLTVLDGLARRALRRGGGALLGDRLSPLAALRLGIFGR